VPLGITSKLFWSSAELKSFQVVIIGLLYVQDERYLAGAWMHWSELQAFVKGILNSSRGLHPQDNSPQAQQARRIQGFADLDGIEFVAKVEMDKDQNGDDKNVVKTAITPDNKAYAGIAGEPTQASASVQQSSPAQSASTAPD
jgi:hypothetical protein